VTTKTHRNPWALVLVLLLAGLLISFWQTLHASVFISNEGSVLRLPVLSWWRNLPFIFSRDFLMFSQGQFRPLSYALLAAIRTFVSPENVVFWHLWLLFFHLLNAILVFFLVRHFCRHTGSAVFACLVFGLHPLATVAVNNINYFHYVLGLTFYLGAAWCYLSFVRLSQRRLYAGAISFFILGIFTSKVVFTLPMILVLYELLYCRSEVRKLLLRISPFVIISVGVSPLWLFYRPHPYYFRYPALSVRAGWNSFFSVVGATGWYLKGLLFGRGVPVILREAVERILRFPHWRFLLWGAIDVGIIAVGGWILRRRRWLGLGLLFVFIALLPFVTTVWNRVDDYIHWSYLYIPTVGLAFFIGGLVDELCSSQRRKVRQTALVVFSLLVVLYGVQQVRLNRFSRSAISYWRRVLRLNPDSETASRELGKSYLDQGKAAEAMDFLFSPAIKNIQPSCLVMSRYYCEKEDYLAAALHLRMSSGEEKGLQFQHSEMAGAELFYAVGALDYAESALGKILMANPYNIVAMDRLVHIWLFKGYPTAAGRLADRIARLAPSYCRASQMLAALEERQNTSLFATLSVVEPPSPEWLRYVTEGARSMKLQEAIISLSDRLQCDPLVQMEAGICLARSGQPKRALSKLIFTTQRLSSFSYAWAIRCWVAAEVGDYRDAHEAGRRALELDPQSSTAHSSLALLFSKEAAEPRAPGRKEKLELAIRHYRQALQFDPNSASNCNNLGNLLRRSGRLDEAVEYYRRALRLKPDFAEAYNNLGAALAQQGKLEEAVQHYRRALRLKADFAEAYNNLGAALAQQGKLQEARAYLRHALDIEPLDRETFYNLVKVLTIQRQFDQVISLLQGRLRQMPGDIGLGLNLAWLLATCPEARLRNGPQAVELAERICRTTKYRNPRALDTLAAAYAEVGRFDEAIQKARLALQIALASGQSKLGKRIEMHLKSYKAHHPVR